MFASIKQELFSSINKYAGMRSRAAIYRNKLRIKTKNVTAASISGRYEHFEQINDFSVTLRHTRGQGLRKLSF